MIINEDNKHIYDGFYRGIVEDNVDPIHSQRCRIRVIGIHSAKNESNKEDGIPTSDLPWAEQAQDFLNSVAIPDIGTYVWVFFENGNHNKPVYFAKCHRAADTKQEQTDIDRIAQPKNSNSASVNLPGLEISTQKSLYGQKVIIKNTENEGRIIIDTFNNQSRIILRADKIVIAGRTQIGSDNTPGYPLLIDEPNIEIDIDGIPLVSGKTQLT